MIGYKYHNKSTAAGFTVLSMTLILVFIMISASLSFAHIQQQRIQRNQFDINYQIAKVTGTNKLDLFYLSLYDSPELLTLAPTCNSLPLSSNQLVMPNAMMQQYKLTELFYVCLEKPNHFNISIVLVYNNTEQLVMQRQLITLSTPWIWQSRSVLGA